MTTYGKGSYGKVLPWGGITHDAPVIPVSSAGNIEEIGILESTIGAIAEEDNEIGGFTLTRLTNAHTAGATTLNVESTLDWPSEGKVGLGGILYYYTGKTDTSLTGITHKSGGTSTPGTAIDHIVDSPVVDVSGERSALERLRRAIWVDYAEEEDLNVIGRNYGVDRLPIFGDDDQFREIIKKMAYCPKGTIEGLELAMTGLVGAGNFEIYEDLIMYNNTVFVKIDSSVITSSVSAGKAYLTGHQWGGLDGTLNTITLSAAPITVQSVTLKDLGELFDFRDDIPSDVQYPYWDGATPQDAFSYQGSVAEGTGVVQVAGLYTKFISNAASGTVYYRMEDTKGARVTDESYVEYSTLLQIPTGSVLSTGKLLQVAMTIEDGAYTVRAGIDDDRTFGLFATEGGGHLGSTVTLALDQFYEITIKKFQDDFVELWIDGQFVDRQDYSAFTVATTNHRVEFGLISTNVSGAEAWFKQLGLQIINIRDYWSAREDGTGTVNSGNPDRFTLSGSPYVFGGSDVGKGLRISGSTVSNPQGGNNNGDFVIDAVVGPAIVDLVGAVKDGASVSTANPTRITVDEPNVFNFPDDLGKQIVISGSTSGNNGTYVISKLLQPGTYADFDADFDTPMKEKTNICEVTAATFTTETGLNWQLNPVFVTESGLDWVQADAGTLSGAQLTFRQSLWAKGLTLEIAVSDVLTGQLLTDIDVGNLVIDPGPPVLYEWYPFYLADPVGAIAAYIDTITVAGVIPEVLMV